MNLMNIAAYKAIEKVADPIIKDYRADLLVHDRLAIHSMGQGTRFLHFTGKTGTCLTLLAPADCEQWPAPGESIPWMLGTATREQILSQIVPTVKHMRVSSRPVVHYWDGVRLNEITNSKAEDIAAGYVAKVENEWKQDREAARVPA